MFIKAKNRETETTSFVQSEINRKAHRRQTLIPDKNQGLSAIQETTQETAVKKAEADQISEKKDEKVASSTEDSELEAYLEAFAPPNAFQALLGLPEISLDTLYEGYKEKDKDVVHYMNEHSNFIQIHEGYPEFLMTIQGGNEGARQMRTFQVNPWSQECGNLDFYVSLDFVNRYYCIARQVQQELYDALKPHNA